MGVRFITDSGSTALYCSTSGWAFGPVVDDYETDEFFFTSEDVADRMIKLAGTDIRRPEWTESKLLVLVDDARASLVKEAKEEMD